MPDDFIRPRETFGLERLNSLGFSTLSDWKHFVDFVCNGLYMATILKHEK